jgi:Putative Actinobacterial Holin-X, holin superfamily III
MSEEPGAAPGRPAIARLVAQLAVQGTALLGQEIALARAELRITARQAVSGGILLTAAAVAGGSAWLAILAAIILGIGVALPWWAAALITGGGLAALSGGLAALAVRRLSRVPWRLPVAAGSLREDLRELQSAVRQAHQ